MNFKKLKIPLFILGLLMATISGYLMYSKFQVEELWGYLPLWFFVGLWGAIVLGLNIFKSKKENSTKLLGLSTLAGIFLSLGFPPLPFTALMFIGFVPLLLAEQEITNTSEGAAPWRVFKYAYHAFVVWNILTTYWVANTAFVAGVFAVWVNALLMSIPIVLFHLVKRRMPNLTWAAFVTFWLTFEYGHLYHELSWPWLTLGNSFSQYPSWIQWYEYTGVFGGTLWILLGNVLFFKIVSNHYFHNAGITLKHLVKPFALVILPILVSLGIYYTYTEDGREVEMVVAQPNFEPHYERAKFNKEDRYKYPTVVSFKAATKETEYFVFPESSFSSLNEKGISDHRLIKDLQDYLRSFPKAKLVMGVGSYRFFEEGEAHTPAIREYDRNGETLFYESYNSAFQISNEDENVQIYHKSLLVPGAEFFPFRNLFPFMKPLVDKLGGSVEGLGRQEERDVFTAADGTKVAPVICYESVYGEYTADYVNKGADALIIMTNDGWWDNTAGHKQHMQFATLRAIENRRSIARSANTGISGFINQRGDITQASNYDEVVALNGKIKLNNQRTFYTRYKDLIARVSLFLSALLLLNLIAKTWLKKAKEK